MSTWTKIAGSGMLALACLALLLTGSCRENKKAADGAGGAGAGSAGEAQQIAPEGTAETADSAPAGADKISGAVAPERLADPHAAVDRPGIQELRAATENLTPAEAYAELEKENVQLSLESITPQIIKGQSRLGALYVIAGGRVNEVDPSGKNLPLLSLSANLGDAGLCEFLLDHGAELEIVDNFRGATPLLWAAAGGRTEVVRMLQARGANPAALSRDKMNGLHLAAMEKHPDTLGYLIEQGLDVNAVDKDGVSPLIYSARSGSMDCATILLDRGADVNQQEPTHGFTPMLAALYLEQFEVADLMLKRGADRQAKMNEGQTAATIVSGTCPIGGVKWLIENHFDLNVPRGDNGNTLLIMAAGVNTPEVIQTLLLNGADPRIRNKAGKTALDVAREAGKEDIAAVIEAELRKTKQS